MELASAIIWDASSGVIVNVSTIEPITAGLAEFVPREVDAVIVTVAVEVAVAKTVTVEALDVDAVVGAVLSGLQSPEPSEEPPWSSLSSQESLEVEFEEPVVLELPANIPPVAPVALNKDEAVRSLVHRIATCMKDKSHEL